MENYFKNYKLKSNDLYMILKLDSTILFNNKYWVTRKVFTGELNIEIFKILKFILENILFFKLIYKIFLFFY